MKLKPIILALAAVSLGVASSFGQTTLSVGDIQVTGVTSDANDSFSFVLWKPIAFNTVIRFTDNSFSESAGTTFLSGTEEDMSITFTSSVAAGSVIRFENNVGLVLPGGVTATASGSLSGTSSSGDQVFAYQGGAVSGTSFTGRTLLHGFNIADTNWTTGTPAVSTNNSFLPTAISGIDANLDSGNFDNADYNGVRTGLTTAAYRAAISNLGNYTQNDTRFDLSTTGFTSSSSASLHWDANGTTANNGGAGTWDTTTQSRFKNGASGTTYLRWVNSSADNDHTAVFGGTAGAVTVSGGVTASGLKFDTTGYTLTGSTITLSGSAIPMIDTGALNATINSELAGTQGFNKIGAGTLTLGSANSYSGDTTIKAGTLKLGASGAIASSASIVVGDGGSSGVVLDTTDKSGFTIGDSQTLKGIGQVNVGAGKTLTIEGTHSVGNVGTNGGVGTQSVAGNIGYTSSIFNWDLDPAVSSPDPGVVADNGSYDKVTATGSITGASSVFNVVLGAGKSFTDDFWNTDKSWTDVFTGSSAPNLALIFTTFGGSGVAVDGIVTGRGQFGFTGSSLTWTAVPEPSSALAGLLIAAGVLRRRRVA